MDIKASVANTGRGLERLRVVLGAIGPGDLERPTSAGWRVVAMLGHLAYWDEWVAARWRRRLAHGVFLDFPDEMADMVNLAAEPLWHSLRREDAVDLAMRAAVAVTAVIVTLPEEAVEDALRTGRQSMVDRSLHWGPHLDDIERALATAGKDAGYWSRGRR